MLHRVYLVPGFFGFANLGDLAYFTHVRDAIARAFVRLEAAVEVHVVRTWPTASLRRRAARVLEVVADTAGAGDVVHLVGHSSGGLDARLAASPGVALAPGVAAESIAARVRSVLTVATPHRGTPVASFFTSVMGQRALRLLSLATIYMLRFGRLPLGALLRLGGLFAHVDDRVGLNSLLLDQLFAELLGDFSPERRAAIEELFVAVEREQDLLVQLTPEAMDLFEALTLDRPGVRYGCVVTQARPPGVLSQLAAGFDPSAQATHAIYQALYRLASRTRPDAVYPVSAAQLAALEHAYAAPPTLEANDGVVPTCSQVRGEVVAAVLADHLDVIGHFGDPQGDVPHYDWLTTGSGFALPRFEALWTAAAAFLVGASAPAG